MFVAPVGTSAAAPEITGASLDSGLGCDQSHLIMNLHKGEPETDEEQRYKNVAVF